MPTHGRGFAHRGVRPAFGDKRVSNEAGRTIAFVRGQRYRASAWPRKDSRRNCLSCTRALNNQAWVRRSPVGYAVASWRAPSRPLDTSDRLGQGRCRWATCVIQRTPAVAMELCAANGRGRAGARPTHS
jgi:hypothetical protein